MGTAAKTVSVELRIGDVSVPVSSLTLYHSIDQLPYAEFMVQLDNQNAVDALNSKLGSVAMDLKMFATLNRLTQEKIMNDFRLTPDVQIGITDGDGNQMIFKGILGQPDFEIQEGQNQLGFTAAHPGVLLQLYNSQIYAAQEAYGSPFLADLFDPHVLMTDKAGKPVKLARFKDDQGNEKTDSIADRIRVILEGLRDHCALYQTATELNRDQFDFLPLHNLNGLVLPLVLQVLKDSKDTTVIDGIAAPEFTSDSLHLAIFNILTNSPGFVQALLEFNNQFMFQLNADWEGKLWLEPQQQAEEPNGRMIKSALEQIKIKFAPVYEPPLVQAIMVSPGPGDYALSGEDGVYPGEVPLQPTKLDSGELAKFALVSHTTSLKAIAKYPENVKRNAAGNYYLMSTPAWLGATEQFSYVDAATAPTDFANRFAAAVPKVDALREKAQKQTLKKQHIMAYLVRQKYHEHFLKFTTGSVTIPLTILPRVGRTYLVADNDGKPGSTYQQEVFTGFLHTVTHRIVVTTEGGSATTSLGFSHIRTPESVIDGLDDAKFVPAGTSIPNLPFDIANTA